MSLIAEKHDALLSCLQKIYDVLLEMRYISKDDIVQPPQTTNAILDDTLQGLGYESEVIELIKLMPALRGEIAWGYRNDGTELTPRSKAVSYLIDQNSEWTEYLRWGDHVMSPDHKILPAWMLRLTIGNMEPSQYGTDLLYDIRECKITEWTHTSAKLWDESPSLSTETALAGIVAKLTTLEWVPYFNSTKPKSREILENPLIFQNIVPGGMQLPTDPRSAIEQLQSSGQNVSTLRDSVNRWRSFQKLYQDCGWGIDTFDGGEFERRRQEWCARLDDLDRQKRIARRMSEAQREALRLATERFWAESADSNGV